MNQKDQEGKKIIKDLTEVFLKKMGFQVEIGVKSEVEEGGERIICEIKTEESNFLIGQYGGNLNAIEHLIRLLVRKKTEEKIKFIIDINSYKQEKNNSIISLARKMAEKALLEKRAVILRPMSPYERRLIHLELAENPQVTTESTGDNENRKVIIKPVGLV